MYRLLHAGFDKLDIAFDGAVDPAVLECLRETQGRARESLTALPATLGPGKVKCLVQGYGMRGGYAFVIDTGPLGESIWVKDTLKSDQWPVFVSVHATALLAATFDQNEVRILETLKGLGMRIKTESVNRVDYAVDFATPDTFRLQVERFVAHARCKIKPHWGKKLSEDDNRPSAVLTGRGLESVTVGKMPGRQVIVYDKRREAIEKHKAQWFEVWGVDRADPDLRVWRVEVRAGKDELKDRWNIRSFADIRAGFGDVVSRAVQDVRYLEDGQTDSNVSRQTLHPLWIAATDALSGKLIDSKAGLAPGRLKAILREEHAAMLRRQIVGLVGGWAVTEGLDDNQIHEDLPEHVGAAIEAATGDPRSAFWRNVRRKREENIFLD